MTIADVQRDTPSMKGAQGGHAIHVDTPSMKSAQGGHAIHEGCVNGHRTREGRA